VESAVKQNSTSRNVAGGRNGVNYWQSALSLACSTTKNAFLELILSYQVHFADKGFLQMRTPEVFVAKNLKGELNPYFRPYSFELNKKIDFYNEF